MSDFTLMVEVERSTVGLCHVCTRRFDLRPGFGRLLPVGVTSPLGVGLAGKSVCSGFLGFLRKFIKFERLEDRNPLE